MRITRRGRLSPAALPAMLALLLSAGCRDNVPPASGSTTYNMPPRQNQELPDTPAPLEELGTESGPDVRESPPDEADSNEAAAESTPGTGAPEGAAATVPMPTRAATREVFVNVPGAVSEGESWTSFRNGLELRGIAESELPAEPELLWEVPTEHGTRSTAAIVNGRVYIGTLDGYVLCLNLRNGEEIWRYRSIESTDPEEFAPGFNAPTTVSDQAVYIGDEDGVFHAIDRTTGEKLWTFETQGEIVGGASLLPGNRVMFGSHDGRLYCLAADSAEPIWQFEALGPINGTQAVSRPASGNAVLAPTAGQEERYTFVTGCDKPTLRVVNTRSGEQVTEVPLGEALLIASPALMDGILYFGSASGEVIALDWQDQSTEWIYADPEQPAEVHSSPAVTDEVVIIGSRDRRVHCIDRETGEGRWVFETRGWVDGSPVVVGERVFFGSADRFLYAVNIDDGSEAWKYQVGQRISGSAAVAEGYLVIAADDRQGRIMCFGTPQP